MVHFNKNVNFQDITQWNENQFSDQKNGRVRKKSTFNFYKNNNNFWFRKLQFIVTRELKKKKNSCYYG
jgi:hypothetical protein